jgi:hypothetical protein|tara:strand:+ start:1438 stop:1614 length:177 start_codon:yes stop_codon:yes gene_type:complete
MHNIIIFSSNPPLNETTIIGVTMDASFGIEEAKRDLGYNPIDLYEGYKQGFANPEDRF